MQQSFCNARKDGDRARQHSRQGVAETSILCDIENMALLSRFLPIPFLGEFASLNSKKTNSLLGIFLMSIIECVFFYRGIGQICRSGSAIMAV